MKIKSLGAAIKIAQEIFKNKDKVKEVFNQSTEKVNKNKDDMGSGLFADVITLRKMLSASIKGTYKFSKRTIIYVIAGLLYFISPVDLIPEILLGPLGFFDDAAVVAMVLKRISSELTKFKSESTYEDAEVIS